MKLIISETIRRKELDPLSHTFPQSRIINAAQKVMRGLGIPIKYEEADVFIKLPLTSPGGAARTLWLMRQKSGNLVILLLRKKDDLIGRNMASANPLFSDAVDQALTRFASDVARGAFDVIELPEA